MTQDQENAKTILSLLTNVAVKFDDCAVGASIKLWLLNIQSGQSKVVNEEGKGKKEKKNGDSG